MKLWLAGRYNRNFQIEIIGIFDTEQGAVDACVYTTDFIGPLMLNKRYSTRSRKWTGAYFPRWHNELNFPSNATRK